MKQKLLLLILVCLTFTAFSQEEYTILKVVGENVPTIDGTIDEIWSAVEIVPLEKVPDEDRITETDPDSADFYAEFGALWNENGIFFLFTIVDDDIVIEDDDATLDAVPNDQWWTDDNYNILFNSDLFNKDTWEQWEFAWQANIDQEEKLSSDDWLNAAKIDQSLVESAWYQDGDMYTLETFIDWGSFPDVEVVDEDTIYFEMRARDDDSDDTDDGWVSMYQWSTADYNVEGNGDSLGAGILSSVLIELTSGKSVLSDSPAAISLYPNQITGTSKIIIEDNSAPSAAVHIYNIQGKLVSTGEYELQQGTNRITFNAETLEKGSYLMKVSTSDNTEVLRFTKL